MDTKVISPDKLKEVLISRTVDKTSQSEDIVDKIINFEFKEARDAFKQFGEVEISGFGKFVISQAKLRKKLKRLIEIEEAYILKFDREGETMTDRKKQQCVQRLNLTRESIGYLKTKLNEN